MESGPAIDEAEKTNNLHHPQLKYFVLCLSWPHLASNQFPPLPSFTPFYLLVLLLHAQGSHCNTLSRMALNIAIKRPSKMGTAILVDRCCMAWVLHLTAAVPCH
eukprot:11666060-Ditylum_brightwellii.AAC.2